MAIATLIILALWLVAQSSTAPTLTDSIVESAGLQDRVLSILDTLCTSKKCLFGPAGLDLSDFSCLCPDWPEALVS